MTSERGKNKIKELLSNFFDSKRENVRMPDGTQLPSGVTTSIQYHVNNAIHVNGAGNAVTVARQDGQGDRHLVSQVVNLLSQHIVCGAAHDDSARDPPPDFFDSKRENVHMPDGAQLPGGVTTSIQYHVNNAIHVNGAGNAVATTRQDGQGDRHIVSQVMNLLSQHIICGAAHDDSARDPPPRCHPDTRVKLIARVTAWFRGKAQQELLLWITGPAGVGKSAVVQTFAEYLAQNNLLGASIFISRPNRRDKAHGIFVTIAYQLSIRIEAYRNFITDKLSIDPKLLNRGIEAQFKTFIVEPFVERKIGAGGKRWGILLDGLDELSGEDAQCKIIQLISVFAHEYRDAPLAWVIASRPEPHISNTFTNDPNRGHWLENISIDSTEACKDVERFLRSDFKTTRKSFRQCTPRNWPSDPEFTKLQAAAAGLFVYAQVGMQFIRDSAQSDPVSRLDVLLTVIDRSKAIPITDNPFVYLDGLYREILSSVPPRLWPSTKRLLSYIVHAKQMRFRGYTKYPLPESLQTLRGMAILFGLPLHVVYACLRKCYSVVNVPDRKVAHEKNLAFHHASFADYLIDPNRSRDLHVDQEDDVERDVVARLLDIWNECSRGTVSVESMWHQYCLQCDDKTSKAITKFHEKLFSDVVSCARIAVLYTLRTQNKSSIEYARLQRVHMIKLCYFFDATSLVHFVHVLDNTDDTCSTELLRRAPLKSLNFGKLNCQDMSPARAHYGKVRKSTSEWILHWPRSSAELKKFVSELESLQKRSPELKVVLFGSVCEGRVAAFRHTLGNPYKQRPRDFAYYIIPYPE